MIYVSEAGSEEANGKYVKIPKPADAPAHVGEHVWRQEVNLKNDWPANCITFDKDDTRWYIGAFTEQTRDLYLTERLGADPRAEYPNNF